MFRCCLKLFLLVAAVVLFCTGLPAAAKAEMRIFELQHRPVSEFAEMVRSLLGEEAKVAAFHNTLAVNASPAALDEVARLVASYDRARPMLRVTIDQGKSFTGDELGVSASGRLRHDNNLVIINPGTKKSRDPGSSLFLDSGQSRLKLRGTDSSLRESRRVSQYISVLEGEPALVSVGRAVPFTSVMLSYCRRHPAFIETTTYEHVDTGFEVLPVLTGSGMVDLEVRPFMAFLDPDNPQQIVFHEMATRVSVPLGSWYELGGHNQLQDGLSREILGGGTDRSHDSSAIRVKVEAD